MTLPKFLNDAATAFYAHRTAGPPWMAESRGLFTMPNWGLLRRRRAKPATNSS